MKFLLGTARWVIVPAFSVGLVAASMRPAETNLDEGIALYWSGRYQETIDALSPLRDAELRSDEKVECLKYLAFSHVAMANDAMARDVFTELLEADPGLELDASQLSPKILRQFELAREHVVGELFVEGKALYAAEEYDAAERVLRRILTLNSEFLLAREYLELVSERLALNEKAARLVDADGRAEAPPEASDDRVYHLTSQIQPPVLVTKVSPEYPLSARRAGDEGTVVITAVVGADGSVRAAKVVRSVSRAVDRAALEAVRRWRYRPAVRNGRPVSVHSVVQLAFELDP